MIPGQVISLLVRALVTVGACWAVGAQSAPCQAQAVSDGATPRLLAAVDAPGLATLCWGAAGERCGAVGALAVLIAGGEDHHRVWTLEGPWQGTRGAKLLAAAGAWGATPVGSALAGAGCAAWLHAGAYLDLWDIVDPSRLRPIPPTLLAQVKDDRAIPSPQVDDLEVEAYWQAILLARSATPEAFARALRKELTRADLMNQPVRNRGKVVRVWGRLVRLRRIEPSTMAAQSGIPAVYEAWVVHQAYGANPTCLLVSELPQGVAPAETLDLDIEGDGYFFKRYRYRSAGPDPEGGFFRLAPLVIGKSFRLTENPGGETIGERIWVGKLLPWLLVIVAGSAASVALLTYWFHRRDEKVRRRLRELRSASMEAFLASGQTWPEPPVVMTTEESEQRNRRWTTPSEN